jgi:hypothetical protein
LGNGNLMTREKVLEAVKLIRTGEVVSLGMPLRYADADRPGTGLRLAHAGRPTGGPYGGKSRTIWNDEFIATGIGQIGTKMDALGHLGCMCGALGDKTKMLCYNGNRLSDMWSPTGSRSLESKTLRRSSPAASCSTSKASKDGCSTSARRARKRSYCPLAPGACTRL